MRRRFSSIAAAWAAVAAAVLAAWAAGASGALDRTVHDLRVRLGEGRYDGPVVIVAIDQASLREFSSWPWPRSRHAALVDRLTAAGASVIGFDIDFSSTSTPAEDAALARAIERSGRVVLGAFKEERKLAGGYSLEYASVPIPLLTGQGAAVGSILMPVDRDGAIRRAPLTDTIAGDPMPAFGLEVARRHARQSAATLAGRVPDPARGLVLDYAVGRPPIFGYGDVLAGRVPDEAFRGRIVLVGATALELQDLRATPLGHLTPGVQVQAYVVDTLLRGGGARPLEGAPAVALALAAALPALALARGRARWAGLALAAAPAGLGLAAALGLARAGLLLAVGPFLVAGSAGVVAHGLSEWAELRMELARVRTRLQALADFGRRADPTRGLEQSTQTVLAVVRDLLGLDRLAVELTDGRVIRPPQAADEPPRRADGPEVEVAIVGGGAARGRLVAAMPRGRSFGAEEQALLEAIAARIGVDSENRSLAADLQAVHLSVIHSLAVAIEMRNAYTGQHCEGVARRAAALADAFGLPPTEVEKIRIGGLLHDIGKIGIPESVLLKPGRFTPEEYELMKRHSEIGHKIIATLPFAEEVKDYVRHHHEHYDGTGYPDRLGGAQLSLGARIVAVADCYEALTTTRPYRKAVTPSEAYAYIRGKRGTFYDPDVVDRLDGVLRSEGVDLDQPVPIDAPWHR